MNNNWNINTLENVQQKEYLEQSQLKKQENNEETQFNYLKELNEKLILFKKQNDQLEANDEIAKNMR